LLRFRSPGQVYNRQTWSKRAKRCSARAPKSYRIVSVLERSLVSKQLELLEPLERLELANTLCWSDHEVRLACFQVRADYNRPMATITEIEKLALDLSENERAVLAAHLLGSLPPVLHDEDEGIAEALRRDAEFEANPSAGLSLEQLDQQIERRRT
jgi:putative addiction module component (TIGR02574 family)